MMDKIAVIYSGGTFGCVGTPLAPMAAADFLPILKKTALLYKPHYSLAFFAAPIIRDSSELHADDWLQLADFITDLAQQDFHRFVIIHGTDTLSYAAALLYHLFADYQIIFTGSQLPLLDHLGIDQRPDSDAWLNLNAALAAFDQVKNGVYIAFGGKLLQGFSALKVHTTDFCAFDGIAYQDFSIENADAETQSLCSLNCYHQLNAHIKHQAAQINIVAYYVLPLHPDALYVQLSSLLTSPPAIVWLMAFGRGNLPYSNALAAILHQLRKAGCWIVMGSQVPHGELAADYTSGSWFEGSGILIDSHISVADSYARLLLNYLIAQQQQKCQHPKPPKALLI